MDGVPAKASHCGTEQAKPPDDTALARLAARQHGVVALAQLRTLGLSASGVRSRVARGRLHRLHRGVYAVGHARVTRQGHWLAAVLACGADAVLSHRSAAALWGLRPSDRSSVDVTTFGRAGRSRAGIDEHSGATLDTCQITSIEGIPCTTVARTLLDLAGVVDRRALSRAVNQAEVLRVFDARAVEAILERANGRRGAAALRAAIADHEPEAVHARSELEQRFLDLCSAAGAPGPTLNARLSIPGGSIEVDFLWRRPRLIAELDGNATHGTRQAFEHDRRRDQLLTLAGWRVVRFTWRQLEQEPERITTTIAALTA